MPADSPVRATSTFATIATYAALTAVGLFMLLPLASAASTALKAVEQVYAVPLEWWVPPRWQSFAEAWNRLPLGRFLLNSLVITVPSVIGAVWTSSMAGFALARWTFRGRGLCLTLIVAGMFIPAALLLIPRYLLFDALGWVNTYKPLIVPAWLGGGAFNILLFRQFFRAIPREWEDAAVVDGASVWEIYRRVFLPAATPAVVAAATLSFVYHWQEFLDPLLYLSDFETFPISVGLQMYASQAGPWVNLQMAASLIALTPAVLVFLLGEKYIQDSFGALSAN